MVTLHCSGEYLEHQTKFIPGSSKSGDISINMTSITDVKVRLKSFQPVLARGFAGGHIEDHRACQHKRSDDVLVGNVDAHQVHSVCQGSHDQCAY